MDAAHILGGRNMSKTKWMVGAMAAGCLFAAGCVVRVQPVGYASPPPPPGPVAPEGEIVVQGEPPALIVEAPLPVPVGIVDPFWIAGWWEWDGRWVWNHGYWDHRHPGGRWYPHGWVRGPHGWVFHRGGWR
jgi:hypothetical protein